MSNQREIIVVNSKTQTVERIPTPPDGGVRPKRPQPPKQLDVTSPPTIMGKLEDEEAVKKKPEKFPPTCEAVKQELEMMDTT